MKRIGVDIDDTLAVHYPELLAHSNEHYGTALTAADYDDDWRHFWAGLDVPELRRRARFFHEATVAQYARIENAAEMLARLGRKYDLVAITARADYLIDRTHTWLGEHFDGVFSSVHFVPVWDTDTKRTKGDICREQEVDLLIDDTPKHCNAAIEAGAQAILFGGYHWSSRYELHPSVIKANDWLAVGAHLDA